MLVKTQALIPYLLPAYKWSVATQNKEVFLTFDDGPTPEITLKTLDLLDEYKAKATFFLVGANVKRFPEIAKEVLYRGHTIGNHTYSHLNGWKTTVRKYLLDIQRADQIIEQILGIVPTLFRPPYGKINFLCSQTIRHTKQIIMWDVLARDFDPNTSFADCIHNIKKYSEPGSTIVLHDSLKCGDKLLKVLPTILPFFQEEGYQLSKL